MNRIICIGSRLLPEDGAGPSVFELLEARSLPPGVEVLDGGLGGLSLLRAAEGAGTVVFVDAVAGFGEPGEALLVPPAEVAAEATPDGHDAGLPSLLAFLPHACETPPRRVAVVGLEVPWSAASVVRAADLALAAAAADPEEAA